ncbi:zf-DNL-domain-containing protein [Lepidopterella palustris CBS 459.81]|uniref:Zf-DNL-domain-containing protein n=1 Tax=Lepidopterella palustris CBS 459.81 TaxID=1314670 RepID=A0A8E2JKB3_9PEZI|nr:zf-DNL-domain-containing protein [Lepidopterella palustris CBS 459.81]
MASRPQLHSSIRSPILSLLRHESTASLSAAQASSESAISAPESRLTRDQVPAYEMTFTCNKCATRQTHRVSKQGYEKGTVLITCPGCKNRHLMADHLKIFSDKSITIEDILREKGHGVKRGELSAQGDFEFWDDGSVTQRSATYVPNTTIKAEEGTEEGRLTESPKSESH